MGVKILVVDDSEFSRQEVVETLAAAGFESVTAGNGKEGLAALAKNPDICLIITDLNMPIMDGITMCESLEKKIPTIMLTSDSVKESKNRAKDAGVKFWIVKPMDPVALISGIKSVLDS